MTVDCSQQVSLDTADVPACHLLLFWLTVLRVVVWFPCSLPPSLPPSLIHSLTHSLTHSLRTRVSRAVLFEDPSFQVNGNLFWPDFWPPGTSQEAAEVVYDIVGLDAKIAAVSVCRQTG